MVDVVSDQTEITYAESTTGWSGDTFVLENEIFVQGSNSVAVIQTANGANDVIFTIPAGSWNMANKHLRMYMSSNIMPNTHTEANNGIQLFAGDGTNTAYWTVGGSDTYGGGWRDFFIDIESTPTSGTVNTAAVTNVGIRINTSSKPRNSTNGWYDNWRFGNGLEINSTTTEAIDFTDVATDDALPANKYDILELVDGVLFGKGKLTLGNAAGSKNCNLVSSNETIFFVDRVVATTLYALIGSEGTGATDIDISGLVCKTVGTSAAEVDFSASITSFAMQTSTFIDMGTLKFAQGTLDTTSMTGCGATTLSGSVVVTGCAWTLSALVTHSSSGALSGCTFTDGTGTVALEVADLGKISDCAFDSDGTGHAIRVRPTGAGPFSYSHADISYTGYAGTDGSTGNEGILIDPVTSSADITISVTSGATPTIMEAAGYTGTFTLVSGTVPVTVKVVDESTGLPLQSAHVYLHEDGNTSNVLISGATDVNGEISVNHTYAADLDVVGWVRQMDLVGADYTAKDFSGTITDTGFSTTIALTPL